MPDELRPEWERVLRQGFAPLLTEAELEEALRRVAERRLWILYPWAYRANEADRLLGGSPWGTFPLDTWLMDTHPDVRDLELCRVLRDLIEQRRRARLEVDEMPVVEEVSDLIPF